MKFSDDDDESFSQNLNIYLLKENYTEEEAIKKTKRSFINKFSLKKEYEIDGSFFFLENERKQPKWLPLIKEIISEDQSNLLKLNKSYTPSGLLIFIIKNKYIAISFGYGYTLLDYDSFEYDFGIKTTINFINPQKIRALKTKSLELSPTETEKSSYHAKSINELNINGESQLLRLVSGIPLDNSKIKHISGAQSIIIKSSYSIIELKEICKQLLDYYQSDNYLQYFGWIDYIKIVRDIEKISYLDKILVENFNKMQLDNFSFYPPIYSNYSYDCSLYIKRKDLLQNIDVDEFTIKDIASLFNSYKLSKEDFNGIHVQAKSDSGELIDQVSLYKSLIFEYKDNTDYYLLNEGNWYKIDDNYYQIIENFYANIEKTFSSAFLLPWRFGFNNKNEEKKECEATYNKRICGKNNTKYVVFDKENISYNGKKFEFCDIFTKDLEIIHVKRYWNGSSSLSHIFVQSSVSAKLLRSSDEVRTQIKEKLPGKNWNKVKNELGDTLNPKKFTIKYAILKKFNEKEIDMPLLFKIGIMDSINLLKAYGYNFELVFINSEENPVEVDLLKCPKKSDEGNNSK